MGRCCIGHSLYLLIFEARDMMDYLGKMFDYNCHRRQCKLCKEMPA